MTGLRPSVVDAKARLTEGRARLRQQHDSGSPGIQVCVGMSDLFDSVLLHLYETALDDLNERGPDGLEGSCVLVPHGGYGRRDVAPFSDVDLLLLHRSNATARIRRLAARLIADVSDVGLQLGFHASTPAEACRMATEDACTHTSLGEARFLGGAPDLFPDFQQRLARQTRRRSVAVMAAIEQARREDRSKYGETVHLLEPNIKRSRGGLRDLQLLRWIGFVRFGDADPERLHLLGALTRKDHGDLRKAWEFLLRLRNELHFHAGRALDMLSRDEQLRIARHWSYADGQGLLPVERFMRDYFQHTSQVRDTVSHFAAAARKRSIWSSALSSLISHHVSGEYRVDMVEIRATRRGMAHLRNDLVRVLRLLDLANLYNRRIEHGTWQTIRQHMSASPEFPVTAEAAERFLSLLSQTPRLGDSLRRLHELRVLERLVVGWEQARYLLQFNTYHKFTVDEHSIQAVEKAAGFVHDTGLLGNVYRSISQRHLLHLALLIHDLGKALPGDHSDVGKLLATETAQRLRLDPAATRLIEFLVQKHLLMSHLAFRRDTRDKRVLVQFAADVGSPEMLRMLYVMTCADLAAVGPGVLNQWKLDILGDLYRRTLNYLDAGSDSPEVEQQLELQRSRLRATIAAPEREWYERQIAAMPAAYLLDREPEPILDDLARVRQLRPDEAVAWGRYLPERDVVEYSVAAHETLVSGIFHRLTGALSGQGLDILAAEIHSLADGLVLDRFYVEDPDFTGCPADERFQIVGQKLREALEQPSDQPSFRRLWHTEPSGYDVDFPRLPTRINIDNSTSPAHTIVDIFAQDRIGLLYQITRTLYSLGASVRMARIGTHLDQVVDVFYITDKSENKIRDPAWLERMRSELLLAIEEDHQPTVNTTTSS